MGGQSTPCWGARSPAAAATSARSSSHTRAPPTFNAALPRSGARARVHWRFLPRSYAEWVALRSAPPGGVDRNEPPGGKLPWRVTLRWATDSEHYNECAPRAALPPTAACSRHGLHAANLCSLAAHPLPFALLACAARWMQPQDYEADEQKAKLVAEAQAAAALVRGRIWGC